MSLKNGLTVKAPDTDDILDQLVKFFVPSNGTDEQYSLEDSAEGKQTDSKKVMYLGELRDNVKRITEVVAGLQPDSKKQEDDKKSPLASLITLGGSLLMAGLTKFVRTPLTAVAKILTTSGKYVGKIVIGTIGVLGSALKGAAIKAFNYVGDLGIKLVSNVTDGLKSAGTFLVDWIKSLLSKIPGLNKMFDATNKAPSAAKNVTKKANPKTGEALKSSADKAVKASNQVKNTAVSTSSKIAKINNAPSAAKNVVSNTGKSALKTLSKLKVPVAGLALSGVAATAHAKDLHKAIDDKVTSGEISPEQAEQQKREASMLAVIQEGLSTIAGFGGAAAGSLAGPLGAVAGGVAAATAADSVLNTELSQQVLRRLAKGTVAIYDFFKKSPKTTGFQSAADAERAQYSKMEALAGIEEDEQLISQVINGKNVYYKHNDVNDELVELDEATSRLLDSVKNDPKYAYVPPPKTPNVKYGQNLNDSAERIKNNERKSVQNNVANTNVTNVGGTTNTTIAGSSATDSLSYSAGYNHRAFNGYNPISGGD